MKPRRDITLGEMQDECKRAKWFCTECDMKFVCPTNLHEAPQAIDLTDPPRFNEKQTALLKVFYDRGFRKVITGSTKDALVDCIREFLGVGEDVSLDLAEMFGKESNEK